MIIDSTRPNLISRLRARRLTVAGAFALLAGPSAGAYLCGCTSGDSGALAATGSDRTAALTVADAGGSSGPCPTGKSAGAINNPDASCLVFTPTITGASDAGQNATDNHYALSPLSAGNGELLLFLNGTNGHPSESIADPTLNLYNAGVALGYQVLALSYHSDGTISSQCKCADSCYFPTRESIIRGVYQDGGAPELEADGGIRVDEGVAGRLALALGWLVTNDPTHGWSNYLMSAPPGAPPEEQIRWSRIVVAGHSQGGGHAAAIGKLFQVARVLQFSSTCDAVAPTAGCSKADGGIADATPATWMTRTPTGWATPFTSYWGLDAKTVYDGNTWVSGDGVCFLHAQIWQNEQEPAAQIDDDGGVCGATTSEENHQASIHCATNYPVWEAMLEDGGTLDGAP